MEIYPLGWLISTQYWTSSECANFAVAPRPDHRCSFRGRTACDLPVLPFPEECLLCARDGSRVPLCRRSHNTGKQTSLFRAERVVTVENKDSPGKFRLNEGLSQTFQMKGAQLESLFRSGAGIMNCPLLETFSGGHDALDPQNNPKADPQD